MNGRVYDANIGRFLQADPHVQAPNNSQNYNRYAYVLNNPMSYTDPSGYFFKKLLRSIAKIPILNMAVQVTLTAICGYCVVAYNAISTYAVTGSLKAAAIGAVVSAISPGGLSPEAALGSAIIGGLASKAQGGKFGHGFVSAGLGAALGGRIKLGNAYANVLVSAVIGGTVSKLTGGKFSNGAQTWAFSAAMQQDWKSRKPSKVRYDDATTDNIKGTVEASIESAKALTINALASLDNVNNGDPDAVKLFEDFFGEASEGRVSIVRAGYKSILETLSGGIAIELDIFNNEDYAYVYNGGQVKVYLTRAFFSAGTTGYHSQGGIMLHEIGHEALWLDDLAYGVEDSKFLAIKEPMKVFKNADSYELYAESL